MQLKAFEAGRYDDSFIVVRNPENGKQELFTEEEFEIVKFLKQNEEETLLALLLPNIGIAKKHHIVICLKVISKLKRMAILDYFGITGKQPLSNTGTLEMEVTRRKLEFSGFGGFATALLTLGELAFGWLGAFPLLALTLVLAAVSFALFPFEAVDAALKGHHAIRYERLFPVLYFVAMGGLFTRAFLQAAFLRGIGRRSRDAKLGLLPPFVTIEFDRREVNQAGRGARVQQDLVGLLSPLALSAVFSALAAFKVIPVDIAFYAFSASVGLTLVLACPFLPFDVADIIHVLTTPEELRESLASRLRRILRTKGAIGRDLLLGLLVSFGWILAWLDSLRAFAESVGHAVSEDLYFYEDLPRCLSAGFLVVCFALLLVMPVLVFAYSFARDFLTSRRARLVVAKDKVKDSLTFEERMAALERIPLFAYLNDQERLLLLGEMQTYYFGHGETLVRQGEVGDEFFVLVKGAANAVYTDGQGKSHFLADLGVGDAFGEIALIDDVPRTASIVSEGGCIALGLKKEGFERFSATLGSSDRVKVMIRLTSFFRRHPLFSKLGAKDQAQLIDSVAFETITAGEEISEGDERFRVIYSGKVRVDTGDDSADTELHPDDCFGYASAIRAKYFASEGTGLLTVNKEDFYALVWEKLVERPELFV